MAHQGEGASPRRRREAKTSATGQMGAPGGAREGGRPGPARLRDGQQRQHLLPLVLPNVVVQRPEGAPEHNEVRLSLREDGHLQPGARWSRGARRSARRASFRHSNMQGAPPQCAASSQRERAERMLAWLGSRRLPPPPSAPPTSCSRNCPPAPRSCGCAPRSSRPR